MNYKIVKLYDFCLNPNICMLKPIVLEGRNYSLVFETKRMYVVPCTVTRLINRICASLGTTLDAALDYSNNIFKDAHIKTNKDEIMIKLPIVLSVINQSYILFPTASPRKKHAAWILWQNFRGHSTIGQHEIRLHFKNDVFIDEQISFTTLSRQQYYSSILYFRHMDDMLTNYQNPLQMLFNARSDLFLVP